MKAALIIYVVMLNFTGLTFLYVKGHEAEELDGKRGLITGAGIMFLATYFYSAALLIAAIVKFL